MPMVNTSHTKILGMIINAIPLSKDEQDSLLTTYNLDCNFVVDIPTKKDYKEVGNINHNINCHTDGPIGVNKLKNYQFHFSRNKISLRFLPKDVVYFMLHFWHS